MKLQGLQKVQIWAFGFLVQQINSLHEVLKLKQIFQKNKVVTGKTPFFLIGSFCSHHFICLNIGWTFSILVLSTKNRCTSFLEKAFVFQKICFKVKVLKTFKVFSDCHMKTCWSLGLFWKSLVSFLEEPMLFLLALKWNL